MNTFHRPSTFLRPWTFLLLLIPQLAMAVPLEGRVVQILDGDSLLLEVGRQRHSLNLLGIDAPERVQAFGAESRAHLAGMAFNKPARAECKAAGLAGRLDCTVWVQPADCTRCGLSLDLGHAQVLAGMAWWNPQAASSLSEAARGRYQSAALMAQARRLGLWSERNPAPPWAWRQSWGLQDE